MFIVNRDRWAYDISKNVLSKGEVWDVDAINQSIEMILGTNYYERPFNSIGSDLGRFLFESISSQTGEELLNSIINSIRQWEDRIIILDAEARMIIDSNNNTVYLTIPYIIKRNNIKSEFDKKIKL